MTRLSGTVSKAWLAAALGVEFDRRYYLDVDRRREIDRRCHEHVAEVRGDLDLFYSESNLGRCAHWNPRQVLVGGIQPNLILGMLLGADLVAWPDQDADITPGCLVGRQSSDLPAPEALLDDPLVRLLDDQCRAVLDAADGSVPIPPFFWDASGRAAVHGAVTTAQKLVGEEFFVAMLTAPGESRRLLDWIVDATVALVRHFSAVGKLPVTSVHIGECSACMIGPELVERFAVPAASRIGRELGSVRFHSCGGSDALLASLASIDGLGSLDVGGDTSMDRVREIFGRDLEVTIAPLVGDLGNADPEALLAWAERVLDDNDGGRLEIIYHLEPGYRLDSLRALDRFIRET